MGLLSILTGGVSKKYAAVQNIANDLSTEEAVYCYSFAHSQLCFYLENPFDPCWSMYQKTAYVEAIVALYERLRGSDPWFSMNKGSFRMALVKAVIKNFHGQNYFDIRQKLREFDYHGDDREWSEADQDRLALRVFDMHAVGP